jgi:hypothetical protein
MMEIWSPYFGARTRVQRVLLVLAFIVILLPLTFVLAAVTSAAAFRLVGRGREFAAWWILFGLPLVTATCGWVGLWLHWRVEQDALRKIVSLLLTTGAALLAVGEIAYVHFVRDLSWQEGGRLWGWILLLSFLGFIAGLFTLRAPRWFSVLALVTSSWMLALSFFEGMSI